MSHRSPAIKQAATRPSTSPQHTSSSTTTSSSYAHLHDTLTHADSSSDDDIDPRWTHPKVAAAAAAAGSSPTARRAAASRREGASTDTATDTRSNFTRSGYAPTTSPLDDTYVNTSGTTGTTAHDAATVARQWSRGIGTLDTAAQREGVDSSHSGARTEHGGEYTGPDGSTHYAGIPAPQVDLHGMTDEQRELVEYLQARVDAFERERVDFLQRLDEMAGTSTERHSLKWDVHKKDEQIMDLQKALSDAHVFLYEERAQVLKLTAENDRLKIQELEDRQRLEHLLALTQPINQEVTYFRECRPEKLTKNYPGQRDDIYSAQRDMSSVEAAQDSPRRQVLNTSNNVSTALSTSQYGSQSMRSARAGSAGTARGPAASGKKKLAGTSGQAQRPVVRTIYLPNENIEILKQIIASLRSQLQEQHLLFEQRIQALQEDRAIREQETAEVQRKARAHIQELAQELKQVNELNKMTTRDYLELRHAAQLNERKLKERASALSQQQVELQQHLKQVEGRAARSETELATENANYVSLFRQQTAATEEDLAIMKAQYAATQDLYEKRIRYLEGRIATLKTKVRTVEERRSLELEGYTTDVSKLRQKLRKLEHTLVNFKVAQLGGEHDPSIATTSSASSSDSPTTARARAAQQQLQQTQKRGQQGAHVPQRIAAKFALMEDDVEKLQNDLTTLARKINST